MLVQSDKRALKRLTDAIRELRNFSAVLNLQAAHILLLVAEDPGITSKEIAKKTGLSQSSCSRNISLLSEINRLGKPGLNLVKSMEDPEERRRKIVHLTEKGKELTDKISRTVQ